MAQGYHPELDAKENLNQETITTFQELIRVIRWAKYCKKHGSIAYHSVRWDVAAQVVRVAWIDTKCDLFDAFTKRLTSDK